jgi:hypothetical protein
MQPSRSTGHELGDDRRRDFLFLSLCLVVLAVVVWVIHVALWGVEVRRVPMMRVAAIIGVYMALMVHARPAAFVLIVGASLAIGEINSRIMHWSVPRCDCFWLSFASGLGLWCLTALLFAVAGSQLTRPPVSSLVSPRTQRVPGGN